MKRQILFAIIVFLFSSGITNAASKVKLAPLLPYNPYNPYAETSAIREDADTDYPKINLAEKKIFGKTYANEDITTRLSRLENKLFGNNYQYMSLSERTDNINQKIGIGEFSNVSPRELSKMEQKIFMETYPNDDIDMRITRLEKEIFGAVQGGEIEERFDTLKNAAKYYNTYPQNFSNQKFYYSAPSYTAAVPAKITIPSIIRNLGSFFSQGALTGYSPNIVYPNNIPYNSFDPFSSVSRGMQNSFSRPGFDYDHFRHFGQGSTVNILQD